jgi:hypothetical protein
MVLETSVCDQFTSLLGVCVKTEHHGDKNVLWGTVAQLTATKKEVGWGGDKHPSKACPKWPSSSKQSPPPKVSMSFKIAPSVDQAFNFKSD